VPLDTGTGLWRLRKRPPNIVALDNIGRPPQDSRSSDETDDSAYAQLDGIILLLNKHTHRDARMLQSPSRAQTYSRHLRIGKVAHYECVCDARSGRWEVHVSRGPLRRCSKRYYRTTPDATPASQCNKLYLDSISLLLHPNNAISRSSIILVIIHLDMTFGSSSTVRY